MQSTTLLLRHTPQSLTYQHGRLLQDSGFTERGFPPATSRPLALTTMPPADGWCYPSRTVTGRWRSGRPEIQSIPKRAGLSTSRLASREIACMFDFHELETRMLCQPSFSARTFSAPINVALPEPVAMPSWEQLLETIRSHGLPSTLPRTLPFGYAFGATRMQLAEMLRASSGDNFDCSESPPCPFALAEILSCIRYKK